MPEILNGDSAEHVRSLLNRTLLLPNHKAAADPTATDDSAGNAGNGSFNIGSLWVNTASNTVFVCVDDTTNAAAWAPLSGDGGGSLETPVTIEKGGTSGNTPETAMLNLGKYPSVSPQQVWGGDSNGTDDFAGTIQAANDDAKTKGIPLEMWGDYYTSERVILDAPMIHCHDATIAKAVTDEEVVRFRGPGNGGALRYMTGRLKAGLIGKPSTAATNAHAFVFDHVLHAQFGHLKTDWCAYGFVNDSTVGPNPLSWGNCFAELNTRGCVQGHIDWQHPGSGSHTGNYFAAVYLNGYEIGGDETILPCASTPVRFDNCNNFSFGFFNFEWMEVQGGGNFILAQGATNLHFQTFRAEGVGQLDSGTYGIFVISSGDFYVTVDISSAFLISFNRPQYLGRSPNAAAGTEQQGTLAFFRANAGQRGSARVGSMMGRGREADNDHRTDFRVVYTNTNDFRVSMPNDLDLDLHFNSMFTGVYPNDFTPPVWIGGTPWQRMANLSDPGATINIGYGTEIRITGTQGADTTTVSAQTRSDQRSAEIRIKNDTGAALTLASGGNIKLPHGNTFPFDVPVDARLRGDYDYSENVFYMTGVST